MLIKKVQVDIFLSGINKNCIPLGVFLEENKLNKK